MFLLGGKKLFWLKIVSLSIQLMYLLMSLLMSFSSLAFFCASIASCLCLQCVVSKSCQLPFVMTVCSSLLFLLLSSQTGYPQLQFFGVSLPKVSLCLPQGASVPASISLARSVSPARQHQDHHRLWGHIPGMAGLSGSVTWLQPWSDSRTCLLCFRLPLYTVSEKILKQMVFVWMQTLCSKVLIPLGTQALASWMPPMMLWYPSLHFPIPGLKWLCNFGWWCYMSRMEMIPSWAS